MRGTAILLFSEMLPNNSFLLRDIRKYTEDITNIKKYFSDIDEGVTDPKNGPTDIYDWILNCFFLRQQVKKRTS